MAAGLGIVIAGASCKHGSRHNNKRPRVFEPNKSFLSNTGYADYYEFFAKEGKRPITLLATQYNNENLEIREVTGIQNNGLLLSGGIPLRIKKEISDFTNILDVYALDDKRNKSETIKDTFFVPSKEAALDDIVGVIDREGGNKGVLLNETINIPNYGIVNAPILIKRLDFESDGQIRNGQSVVDYVGVREDLREAIVRRDALFDAGYSGLFIMRGPTSEVNRLTIEFIRNGYFSTRDLDQDT